MTNEQFDETSFHRGLHFHWMDETVYIKGVDFEERNIFIERLFENPIWVPCADVEIIT